MPDYERSAKIDAEWKEEWENYWKPLLLTDGKFDEQKIKNEMHDLWFIYKQVSEVYMAITGNSLSKPMYFADVIISAHERQIEEAINEVQQECANNHGND